MNKTILKRIYEVRDEQDGYRILIDRLWPRGVKRETAHIDMWAKEIAPSDELRRWFGHKLERFEDFSVLYTSELDINPAANDFMKLCKEKLKDGNVTLLYAAKDQACNHALVLQKWMKDRLK